MSRRPPHYEQGRTARHRELIAAFCADELREQEQLRRRVRIGRALFGVLSALVGLGREVSR